MELPDLSNTDFTEPPEHIIEKFRAAAIRVWLNKRDKTDKGKDDYLLEKIELCRATNSVIPLINMFDKSNQHRLLNELEDEDCKKYLLHRLIEEQKFFDKKARE